MCAMRMNESLLNTNFHPIFHFSFSSSTPKRGGPIRREKRNEICNKLQLSISCGDISIFGGAGHHAIVGESFIRNKFTMNAEKKNWLKKIFRLTHKTLLLWLSNLNFHHPYLLAATEEFSPHASEI